MEPEGARHPGHGVLPAGAVAAAARLLAAARPPARAHQPARHADDARADEGGAGEVSNREAMLEKLADLDAEHAKAVAGGGEKYVDRHHAARQADAARADRAARRPGLAPSSSSRRWPAGARTSPSAPSVVTGIGVIEGVECMITANDPSVKGGASNPWTVKKIFRASQIAEENNLPTVALVESGGADLPTQKEIFIPGGTALPRHHPVLGAARCPTIAIVFGNSTAGGAYVPGMSDYTVMVKEQAKVFLGGPPLVKMATGEESDDESLGGAEMHARTSGLADYLAADEHDALRIGRRIVARLNRQRPASTSRPGLLRRAGGRRRGPARPDPHRPQGAVRPARGDRARRRRRRAGQRRGLRRVQAALRQLAGHRLGEDPRPPGRHPGQRPGGAVLRGGAEGHPVHPARQPGRHPAAVPAQHDRLHGRARSTSRAGSSSTAPR